MDCDWPSLYRLVVPAYRTRHWRKSRAPAQETRPARLDRATHSTSLSRSIRQIFCDGRSGTVPDCLPAPSDRDKAEGTLAPPQPHTARPPEAGSEGHLTCAGPVGSRSARSWPLWWQEALPVSATFRFRSSLLDSTKSALLRFLMDRAMQALKRQNRVVQWHERCLVEGPHKYKKQKRNASPGDGNLSEPDSWGLPDRWHDQQIKVQPVTTQKQYSNRFEHFAGTLCSN